MVWPIGHDCLYWFFGEEPKRGPEMLQMLALALLAATAAIGWRYAAGKKKPPAAAAAKRDARGRYHCVEVRPGVPACEAAKSLGLARFLSGEAPRLPMPGCSEPRCACSYIHHDDRREDDRRNPYGQWANLPAAFAHERRSRVERRQSQADTFRPSITH